jgi:hypothetical protein
VIVLDVDERHRQPLRDVAVLPVANVIDVVVAVA